MIEANPSFQAKILIERIAEENPAICFIAEQRIRSFGGALSVELTIEVEPGNLAGVAVRTLKEIRFRRTPPDLWATPVWLDEGLATLETLLRLRIERRLLEETLRLLAEELRTTSQRVNLFEKVKIPECAENIRRIRIFLGDENTSAVVRSNIAKGKSVKKAAAEIAAVTEGTAA